MDFQAFITVHSIPRETVASDDDPRFCGGGHCSLVYSDGEHSTQKSGSLLWQRNLHCLRSGHPTKQLPHEWFPYRSSDGKYAYVFMELRDADVLTAAIHRFFAE
jgi:hypothetical protein